MKKEGNLSRSFVTGVVALVFIILGYQTALLVHSSSVVKIAANRDSPDTVFVYRTSEQGDELQEEPPQMQRKNSAHSPVVQTLRNKIPRERVESFSFNPNTVSVEELCRLGFSLKQAQSIDNYRKKGGKFRRKSDFAKSFVVSDSIYKRLESYIDIPLIDLNTADSAAFDSLPGVGGWFASRMLEHRSALGGYSYKEQLMDIRNFDKEKFDALSDLITVSPEHLRAYPLWTLPADSLKLHPYIRNYETARAIVIYRENTAPDKRKVEAFADAGIMPPDLVTKLSRCIIGE